MAISAGTSALPVAADRLALGALALGALALGALAERRS